MFIMFMFMFVFMFMFMFIMFMFMFIMFKREMKARHEALRTPMPSDEVVVAVVRAAAAASLCAPTSDGSRVSSAGALLAVCMSSIASLPLASSRAFVFLMPFAGKFDRQLDDRGRMASATA